ncbi:MAG: hypothetical protein A2170_05110 [Deltaproteobacteria bacterium RBG_13_53_10]|nr:MAG: hypothetical protein A2170_05110 [Deltaproteobacteria bacterium RBG_13_53_10]
MALKMKGFFRIVWVLSLTLIILGCKTKPAIGPSGRTSTEAVGFIDTHNHLHGQYGSHPGIRQSDYEGAARVALDAMRRLGIKRMYIMPPPFSPDQPGRYTFEEMVFIVRKYPDRFAFLGGGGTLNVMIQEAVQTGKTAERLKNRFEKKALEILSKGAVGFGELTAEHFSLGADHPYESAPPDHPLFLLLSDIAAQRGVPIDIHMEAIPEDMPLPDVRRLHSPRNPQVLRANIAAFERLLSHNRNSKIIWAHVGWCNTGFRTAALCAELFERHPNLYMSFKIRPDSMVETRPFTEEGRIKSEWRNLILKYPERFVIGNDHFYTTPRSTAQIGPPLREGKGAERLFDFLPPEIGRKIGHENPLRIFRLENPGR